MKKPLFTLLTAALLYICCSTAQAQLALPSFFSDHMVVQRQKPLTVWGTAQPKAKVSITAGTQKVSVRASAAGKWKATLKPLPEGAAYTMRVTAGKESVTITDILVGEVWICSGQSNMEWRVNAVNNAREEIADARYPEIRSFTVERAMSNRPLTDVKGSWKVCSPETAGYFSAVGYFFARELYQQLNVPIGFINTSWGGTDIETWMSTDAISAFPEFDASMQTLQSDEFEQMLENATARKAEFEAALRNDRGDKEAWYAETYNTDNWKTYPVPQLWEGAELGPIDGNVWFTRGFELPAELVGKAATLYLGKIDDNDVTWVNGRQVGKTIGHDVLRDYTLPAGILKAKNVITVKITDTGGGGGIYGSPADVCLKVEGKTISLTGDWKYQISASNLQYNYVNFGPNAYPTLLYNAMLHPLVGLGMRGAIWYQGENNAARARAYQSLFPAMIKDWRAKWNDEFPFYWVQLANFMAVDAQPAESNWAELRKAQSATLSLPRTGQAVTIDVGDANDIHPRNKQDVGKRLAYNALHKDYGFTNIAYSGPVFQSLERAGNRLILTFNPMADALVAKNKYGYLSGFAIAGADGRYHWAQARVEGNKVIASCDEVKTPVAVRYAWGDNPDDANLYNTAGLPASPFEAKVGE